jgi:hydroxymethylglutaryl-CoA reductase (NADPH)
VATTTQTGRVPIPRSREDDYTRDAARERLEFLRERTGADFEHVSSFSFDPRAAAGNVEQSSAWPRCRSA